jgi:hypothetical protein
MLASSLKHIFFHSLYSPYALISHTRFQWSILPLSVTTPGAQTTSLRSALILTNELLPNTLNAEDEAQPVAKTVGLYSAAGREPDLSASIVKSLDPVRSHDDPTRYNEGVVDSAYFSTHFSPVLTLDNAV